MDNENRPFRRGVYLLPNLLTTASLFAGFLGMLYAMRGSYESAALAIFFSALLDGLDGKVARWTNTASEFGVQYDSLADLVAFGVSPAVLLYHWQVSQFGRLGIMACFLFMACGALRLARFNIQSAAASKKFFVGLPIPAAACTLATLVLVQPYFQEYMPDKAWAVSCLVLAYLLSFLMVSRLRYASFKEYSMVKAHPFSSMVTLILLFALVATQPRLMSFLVMFGYMLSGPIYTLIILPRRISRAIREARTAKPGTP